MRILLDSHALLWWANEPEKLVPTARLAIADPANEIFASAASVWELGLKAAKHKLRLPRDFESFLLGNGIALLPFTVRHAMESTLLPSIHGDPFDRALLAQCRVESMTFATRDRILSQYGVQILTV